MLAQPFKFRFCGLIGVALAVFGALTASSSETLENDWFRIEVNPFGGRLRSLYAKVPGMELTDPEVGGIFTESSWDRWKSRQTLANAPFIVRTRAAAGAIDISASGRAAGGQIDFLQVDKRYRSAPDTSALRIDYRFINAPDAMSLQAYCPCIHIRLGAKGQVARYFYPTEDGIAAPRQQGSGNRFMSDAPVRGWFAMMTQDGAGAAITLPPGELHGFYAWFKDNPVPDTEVKFVPVGIENGKSYDVTLELIPFKGLSTVSGVGGGFVGGLEKGVCRIVASRAAKIVAVADGRRIPLAFSRPGEMREFKTSAQNVILEHGGREVCRLDGRPANGAKWALQMEVPRRKAFDTKADLTAFTNFNCVAESPWAKPLALDRPLKVSVITGLGTQIEVGELAARLDMEYRTIGVLGNTDSKNRAFNAIVYTYGDMFGRLKPEDLVREVKKVIEWDSDVILLGGVPLDLFPKELRDIIEARVRAGTGLVMIGQDRDAPSFGVKMKSAKAERGFPKANGTAYEGIPFELLGGEKVLDLDAAGGVVQAECGDGRPYILESVLGKGKAVNLAYEAAVRNVYLLSGLTPYLNCFYEDRAAPLEAYFSLVAKALLRAAGRKLPLEFRRAEVSASGARLAFASDVGGSADLEWSVYNPFREVIAKGTRSIRLVRGGSDVAVPLTGLAPFAGPLSFELVVRRRGRVLNWGAWTFRNEPAAAIAHLSTDASHYSEGQTIRTTVRTEGKSDGLRLRVRLKDAFGRTVRADVRGAAPEVRVDGIYENALCSHSCRIVAELLDRSGAVVSRRQAWVKMRPSRERLAWNDFEIGMAGVFASRVYLWPRVAELYRKADIVKVHGTCDINDTFAPLLNFHTAVSTYAGLLREDEPKEYAKTGDKKCLVRKNCISAPSFFADRAKRFEGYSTYIPPLGLRYHGFGDEQSLTGHEGRPIDFCFSEHCLREFRAFAKGRYGTLERLNAEYDSSFASWDDVMPFTRQEVWDAGGRHVAGWSDHLEFMDSRATNALEFCISIMRKYDPDLRYSLSGTQPPAAYSGMDWWKLMQVLDHTLAYKIGGQLDIHRSFRPDGRFAPWLWGYGLRGNEAVKELWTAAFHGCHGITGFWARSMYRPDWTPTHGITDVLPHLHRLARGVGFHLINNLSPRPQAAMLYSQASFRAAFIEERRAEHDKRLERYRKLLRQLGCAFDYVSYDQLASGVAARRGYRALVLVDAKAMGDDEISGLRAFSDGGGCVLAEGMPATRKANCRPRASSPLAGFFDGRRRILVEPMDDIAADRRRLRKTLASIGVAVDPVAIQDMADGSPVEGVFVFTRADGAGNPFWGLLSDSFEERNVRIRFPRKGWIYDLVDGRAFGNVDAVDTLLGKGHPHAFVQLAAPSGIDSLTAQGARVFVSCGGRADTAVRLRVFRPDGSEAVCYAANLLAKGGCAEHEIPFVSSDAPGDWRIEAENVMDSRTRRTTVLCLRNGGVK